MQTHGVSGDGSHHDKGKGLDFEFKVQLSLKDLVIKITEGLGTFKGNRSSVPYEAPEKLYWENFNQWESRTHKK